MKSEIDLLSACAAQLRTDEGLSLAAYPDPLSKDGKPLTIGYGHTGPEVDPHTVWSAEQCQTALIADIGKAMHALDTQLPWWRSLSPVRQQVLVNLCFNIGIKRLLGFAKALAAMQRKDFTEAAAQMRDSLWYRQVGKRAQRLCSMMEHG